MSEHRQQEKEERHLASCWDCVNDMRLECLELLALVASGRWTPDQDKRLGLSASLDDGWMDLRVEAAWAYLEHTSFTDEDEAMRQDHAEAETELPPSTGSVTIMELGVKKQMPAGTDIHRWLAEEYPRIAEAISGSYNKWDIVVMLRNAAGDLPLMMLNEMLDKTWGKGP